MRSRSGKISDRGAGEKAVKEEKADAEEGGGDGDDGGRQGMHIFIGASAARFPQTTRPYGASIQKGTHQQTGIPTGSKLPDGARSETPAKYRPDAEVHLFNGPAA